MINWKEYKLTELCEIGRGSSPRPIMDQRYFEEGNIPWVKIADATKSGKYIYETKEHINEYGASFSRFLDPDSLIIAASGVSLGQIKFLGVKGCIHDGWLYTSKFKKNIVSKDFLYYFLIFYAPQFHNFSSGAAIQNINTEILRNTKVNLPDLSIQNKIASILSAYDELIENNNQRIKLFEDIPKEIYKEWFVRMRYPGYENSIFLNKDGDEVPHGTLGALPEGWSLKKFKDCLSHYIGGGWGEESPNGEDTTPAHVIRGTDIPNLNKGQLNFDVLRYHSESKLSSRVCQPNDIIFEVSGGTEDQSLGRTSFISKEILSRFGDPVIAASFCKLIRVDPLVVSPIYINSLLNRMYGTNELMVFQVQSTGICNYQFEDFIEATKVMIPSIDIQKRFDDLLTPMFDEIQILGAKNQVLQETRDLLLPRLISGNLSVENINVENPTSMTAESESEYKS